MKFRVAYLRCLRTAEIPRKSIISLLNGGKDTRNRSQKPRRPTRSSSSGNDVAYFLLIIKTISEFPDFKPYLQTDAFGRLGKFFKIQIL